MTSIIAKPLKRFRAAPSRGAQPRVDRSGGDYGAGVIYGVSVITRGEARGHYEWVDQFAIEQVVELGNSARNGIKSRFAHPGLSADGIGTVLGRMKKFRVEGDRALADLHFQKSSHKTPDGDLAGYVMDLADEDPQALATSIVFDPNYGEMDRFVADHEDEDGYFRSPDDDNSNNYRHIRLSKLWADDVVDEPAANPDGLFQEGQEIAAEADRLCEFALGLSAEQPALKHLSVDADRVAQYAARFLDSHNLEIKEKAMNDTNNNEKPAAGITLDELNAFGEALLGKVDEKLQAALKPAEVKPTDVEVERKRCSDLFATAKTAGLADWEKIAQEAIDKNQSLGEFKASIADRLIQQNQLTKDAGGDAPKDPEAKYKQEYAAQRATFTSMNLSEADYITSRKIDDGQIVLAPEKFAFAA